MFIEENYLKFVCPFTMIIAGPTSSGKTVITKRIIKNHHILFTPKIKILKVFWVYGVWQKSLPEMLRNVFIEYFDDLPSEEKILHEKPDLIVVDDLMNEIADDKRIGNLFTKFSHHKNINIIFITQNLYHQGKQMRNVHLNSHYLIIMKNPRDLTQVDILGRQLKIQKELEEAYKDATKGSFGYLVIDFKQTTPREYMLKTRITPEEFGGKYSPIIYVLK